MSQVPFMLSAASTEPQREDGDAEQIEAHAAVLVGEAAGRDEQEAASVSR